MTPRKKSGVWMDHSMAYLIELASEHTEPTTIESPFTQEVKIESLGKSEHIMHNKQQDLQWVYYKQLGDTIKNYDEVLLFGPSTAKNELANLLKTDHHFDKIKVVIENAEKMTENQMQAFVRDHFSKQ
ncbi:MAG: hypothetical protein H7178_02290 [Chitinophagaceae bacterium]|nr:hypothetical protein [Chitinophagaceae bacterium]